MSKRRKGTASLAVIEPEEKMFRGQPYSPLVAMIDGIPTPDKFDELALAYELHTWVHAATSVIAQSYAPLQFKAFRKSNDNQWEEYDGHPLSSLLESPNPFMSGEMLREFTALSLKLTGNAYWALEKDGTNEIQEIWPVPSHEVEAVSSKERPIDHYVYKVNGQTPIKYAYEEMIHFKGPSPTSLIYGPSAMHAAKQAVTADFYAQAWNRYFFQNAARPDAIFESDATISDDVKKRVLASWRSIHGGAQKRGRTAILDGGLKYKEINRSPKDLDFVELRKMAREEILAVFGVPPILVHVMEDANYANARIQEGLFWRHTMIPLIRSVQGMLTLRAKQLYADTETIFESDISNVEALRMDEAQRAATARTYWQMGVPLNALIDKYDLPFDPVEGGDVSHPQAGGGFGSGGTSLGEAGRMDNQAASFIPTPKKQLPVQTAAVDDVYWKSFDDGERHWEERMALSLRSFFRAQSRRVIARWREKGHTIVHTFTGKAQSNPHIRVEIGFFFDEDRERKAMRRATDEFISGSFVDFAVRAARASGKPIDFKLRDPKVLAWLDSKEFNLVQQATDTTKERLSDEIVRGIEDAVREGWDANETINEIANRIDDYYQLAMEGRAEMIARTEIHTAANAGANEGHREAGATFKKWLTSRDDKVRDSHQELEGEVQPFEEPWVLKGDGKTPPSTVDYPGDPDGAPGQIINCRCVQRALFGDEA